MKKNIQFILFNLLNVCIEEALKLFGKNSFFHLCSMLALLTAVDKFFNRTKIVYLVFQVLSKIMEIPKSKGVKKSIFLPLFF